MVQTKLEVFNTDSRMMFDVNTPAFLREACENVNGGMYAVCWNVFRQLLCMVAERATELNDPIMNVLMIRLNLYDIPPRERIATIARIKAEIENCINNLYQ